MSGGSAEGLRDSEHHARAQQLRRSGVGFGVGGGSWARAGVGLGFGWGGVRRGWGVCVVRRSGGAWGWGGGVPA